MSFNSNTVSLRSWHAACVNMKTANYCGDGVAWTLGEPCQVLRGGWLIGYLERFAVVAPLNRAPSTSGMPSRNQR